MPLKNVILVKDVGMLEYAKHQDGLHKVPT